MDKAERIRTALIRGRYQQDVVNYAREMTDAGPVMVASPMQRTRLTVCVERSPFPDDFIFYLPPYSLTCTRSNALYQVQGVAAQNRRTPFLSVVTVNYSGVNCRPPDCQLISQ